MTSYTQGNMARFRMAALAEKSHFFLSQWLKGHLNSADVFVNIREKAPGDCLNISGFELCSKGAISLNKSSCSAHRTEDILLTTSRETQTQELPYNATDLRLTF